MEIKAAEDQIKDDIAKQEEAKKQVTHSCKLYNPIVGILLEIM